MIELVEWETYCPKSKNDKHCVCFRKGNGKGKLICCECKREAPNPPKPKKVKNMY